MALAAPIIADLLSLGAYAQDLYERCLVAPNHFREAKSELLALNTALSHLEFLTKSPVFAVGGGNEAGGVPVSPAVEAGDEKLAIEGPPNESNGNDAAVVKANGDLDVATTGTDGSAPDGVHQIPSPADSPHLPQKTRADIAQLAAGCRGVLQSFDQLLQEHQGLNDIPVKPKGRGNGGIMQLFVGRPSGAIDRYKFAQEGVQQQMSGIRSKLTYHTGAITLMLTVLGSSSLGRIEGSLSKLETMIAAAAEEKERVHTNNVNYYLLAQQNNLNVSPEKQAYMKQRQQKGMGMRPLEFQNLSEQEYYTSMNMLSGGEGGGGGGMRGGGGPRMIKAKGEKQSGGFWGGGHADSEQFFSNINSWSGRPKSSGVLQSSNNRDSKESRDKPREMGFLGSLSRRNTATGAETSMSRGFRDENKKREKKQSDDWTDYMSTGWGDLRPKKTTKAQRLMLPPAPSKGSPTMSGGRGEVAPDARAKEREGKASSSKRRERGDGEKKDKAKKRRSREIDENTGRIEELEDDAEEGGAVAKETENGSKPEKEKRASEDKVVEVGASPDQDEPKSNASVKSKHSSRDQSDAAAVEAKADRHRRKKEKEREREKAAGSGPTKGHGSLAKTRAAPLSFSLPPPVKQKKFSWGLGESHFSNSWEKAEKKPAKPVIAIPVPKKNRSVVNLQHGRNRAGKGEDGNAKSKSRSSKPLSEEDKERRRQRKEHRKAKEGKTEDLGEIIEEGAPATVEEENPETAEKQGGETPAVEPPAEKKKEEETPLAGVGESPEVKEGGETAPVEGDVAAPAVSTEDEAAKKERRKKRKEAKEAAEGKEGEKKPSKHHSTHKPTKDKDHHHHESSSRSVEKGKEKERSKEHREEKHRDDKEKKDKLRRQNTEPITEKEKKEHKSRSKTAPVGDKAGMKFSFEKDVEVRRRMKEKEAQAQQPAASSSLWSKKVLAVARFSMGGQKQEETRRKSGK